MKRLLFVLALLALPTQAQACSGLLNHSYTSLQGMPVNLCDFAGRPILVVNTASGLRITGSDQRKPLISGDKRVK